jgi:hypothetical protein
MNTSLRFALAAAFLLLTASVVFSDEAPPALKIATFDIDATPPVGFMMAYDKVIRRDDLPLRCRGVVLLGAGEPIVLCAVDWIGIANESHDAFREALAKAAGTSPARVAVHTLHQHDAPSCDFTAERLLKEAGAKDLGQFDGGFARETIARAAEALSAGIAQAQTVTHVGWGAAEVQEVASNRRIMGPDGKVRVTRYTATRDPAVRAEPVGVIDPRVCLISFWNADRPLAVLSYYACHPQSYYRTGIPNPDFPGIARFIRGQAVPEALHVHFNGAGGNIGAGKYNDGAKENRVVLALRLADGLRRAWEATEKFPITAQKVFWRVEPVALPPAPHLVEEQLRATVAKGAAGATPGGAGDLAWLLRCRQGHKIDLALLAIGDICVLHMPGELFVEYQLAAQQMHPQRHVAMAAYGDYGPGYIGTTRAYDEGGYETSQRASSVAPSVEPVLMEGMRKLLDQK